MASVTDVRRNLMIEARDDRQGCGADRRLIETDTLRTANSGSVMTQPPVASESIMDVKTHPAPTLDVLTSVLSRILGRDGSNHASVVILDRKPNLYASTSWSEVVACRLPDGSERQVLCKHLAGDGHKCYGHRGGLPYEAEVYRRVLAGIPLTTPAFYGELTEAEMNESWLILEFLEDAMPFKFSLEPRATAFAAQWIGRFHAMNEGHSARASMRFLNRYDAHYYLGWSHRTWRFAEPLLSRYPWVGEACDVYAKAIDWLLDQPATVIHGEYYPINVLFARGSVHPVDWESAAIAAGEIDLACLTERWPEELVREMEFEYQRARWPGGAPAEFERTLAAARLYLLFRWLGDRPEWTTGEQCRWRFEQMRVATEQWKSTGTG